MESSNELGDEFRATLGALGTTFDVIDRHCLVDRALEARIANRNCRNHTLDCHSFNAAYYKYGCVALNNGPLPAGVRCTYKL